jgi:hypothetical protein
MRLSVRKLVVVGAVTLAVGVAAIVTAAAATSTLILTPGQSEQVTCSGNRLTVGDKATDSLTVNCIGGGTTTTTVPPTTTTSTTTPPTTTTSTPTTTTTTTTQPTGGSWWQPGSGPIEWQWEIDHALSTTSATDMGTNDKLPNGTTAPAPTVYDIDGIENPASTVSALHGLGDKAICYIEVGTAGNYYTAVQEGVATTYYAQLQAAGDLGSKLSGYPEYFLNINAASTVSIIESMIHQQCAAKGFDAVETDLDETYSGSDGSTGFTETQAGEQTYLTTLADYMHGLGLAWVAKNLDDTGDNFATVMEPTADATISEQCNQYGTCGALSAFLTGHKAVFNAEYSASTYPGFCTADDNAGINGVLFPQSLNGGRQPCR